MFSPWFLLARMVTCICAPQHQAPKFSLNDLNDMGSVERPEEPRSPRKLRRQQFACRKDGLERDDTDALCEGMGAEGETLDSKQPQQLGEMQQVPSSIDDGDSVWFEEFLRPRSASNTFNCDAEVQQQESGLESKTHADGIPACCEHSGEVKEGLAPDEGEIAMSRRLALGTAEINRILQLEKQTFPTKSAWAMAVLKIQAISEADSAYRFIMRRIHPDKIGDSMNMRVAMSLADRAKEICKSMPRASISRKTPTDSPPSAEKASTKRNSCASGTGPAAPQRKRTAQQTGPAVSQRERTAQQTRKTVPVASKMQSKHWRLGKKGLIVW